MKLRRHKAAQNTSQLSSSSQILTVTTAGRKILRQKCFRLKRFTDVLSAAYLSCEAIRYKPETGVSDCICCSVTTLSGNLSKNCRYSTGVPGSSGDLNQTD